MRGACLARACYSSSTATVPGLRDLALHSQCSDLSSEIWLIRISQAIVYFNREVQHSDFTFVKQHHQKKKKTTEEERRGKSYFDL